MARVQAGTSGPSAAQLHGVTAARPRQTWPLLVRLHCYYNGALWMFLALLFLTHSSGISPQSITDAIDLVYGRDPAEGEYTVPGFNDEPFTDRAFACVQSGRHVHPVQLSQLLEHRRNQPKPPSNGSLLPMGTPPAMSNGIDAYRVISRSSFTMDAAKIDSYVRHCNAYALMLDKVFSACEQLGFNVTRNALRVVDGLNSDAVSVIHEALPVLVVPIWNYDTSSRAFIAGSDGSACAFDLRGSYLAEHDDAGSLYLTAVSRAVREAKTEAWLGHRKGSWKNGWYEDPVAGRKWYAVMATTSQPSLYGIEQRVFDLRNDSVEVNCSVGTAVGCERSSFTWRWGENLHTRLAPTKIESVVILDGSRRGLFVFSTHVGQVISSSYSLKVLISNCSMFLLLARWAVALVALYPQETIGLAALSNSRSFCILVPTLIPRLKSILIAFWTAGCAVEGDQHALSDAWFEIYPAIGEFTMCFFSLLNLLVKALRRRSSDWLFGPTLLFFATFHYVRQELALSPVFGVGGRVSMAVTATELDAASLLDFFTTDIAFRTNGKVTAFFTIKLSVLALVVAVTLLQSRCIVDGQPLRVEKALAICFEGNGGLGSTQAAYAIDGPTMVRVLRPYELVRGGLVVLGTATATTVKPGSEQQGFDSLVLVSIGQVHWLLASRVFRLLRFQAVRLVVWFISPSGINSAGPVAWVVGQPVLITCGEDSMKRVVTTHASALALS